MSSRNRNRFECILCSKRTKANDRRKVNPFIKKYLRKFFLIECTNEDTICNKCRHMYKKDAHKSSEVNRSKTDVLENSSDEDFQSPKRKQQKLCSPPSISVSIKSTTKSHAYCCICRKPGPKLQVVSSEIRTHVLIHRNIWIPSGARCCPGHIREGDISGEISLTSDFTFLNRSTISDVLTRLRERCVQQNKVRVDFDTPGALLDEDYRELTGLGRAEFLDLFSAVEDDIRSTPVRSPRCSLALFLCKMKNGLSNKFLSTLFNIGKFSVRRAISTVRAAMMKTVVPRNLGFQHISRESVIKDHTRHLAQSLLGDSSFPKAILVLDGTYIYIDKSNNFQFQRRSYSMHKGRHLVKPMVITTTSGYFLSILGPYLADAKNNDASILNHILKSNVEDIRTWVEEEDVFVVDRGFRDSLSLLEDLGLRAEMPRFLGRGDKQMNTEDANMSRLVTKVRWLVESANARIKNWKFLSKTLPTNQVPYIGDYVRIVCALSNKYLPVLNPTYNIDADETEAAKMLHLSHRVNELQQYLEENNLLRKTAPWQPLTEDDEIKDFPLLDEDQLRQLTCGVYQMKLSSSYIQEHMDNESDIYIHKEDPNLLRVKIQSRHTSSKKHTLWIRYNPREVESWYCMCRAGARVVGVCSHVAAVLWYLGFARLSERTSYGVRDWGSSVADAAEVIDDSDSSNSSSSVEE